MDRDHAKDVALLLEEATTNIGYALHVVMESWPAEEYEAFRSRSAEVVADISVNLLNPLYERFLDLEPEPVRDKAQLWCHVEQPR